MIYFVFLAPLEYLTLAFDMPYMLLLGDIRQGVFYAVLLSFWLVFAGEHMLVSTVWFEKPIYNRFQIEIQIHISNFATIFLTDSRIRRSKFLKNLLETLECRRNWLHIVIHF